MVVMVKDGACSGPFASNHSSQTCLHVPEPATPLQIAGPTLGQGIEVEGRLEGMMMCKTPADGTLRILFT